jgi:hypothetical protein
VSFRDNFTFKISQPYKSDGITKIYALNLDCLWTKFGFEILFRIPKIKEDIFEIMPLLWSSSEIFQPKYVNVFTCPIILWEGHGDGWDCYHHRAQTCSLGPPSFLSKGYQGLLPRG